MELFPELEKRYTKDQYTAREAQRMAEFIAFGPIVFQASRLLVKYGILELLREHREGLTRIEVTEATGLSEYTVKCLLEAGLCIGTVLVDTETDRYMISKVGWFLLTDEATKVNMDFNNDVNYEGFFHLDESFREHRPAGLKCLGDWDTIYEGLSTLPEPARTSWFAFDHFYSNNSFEEALKVIFDRPVRNLLDVGDECVIIGGGVVGVETALFLDGLGKKVTITVRSKLKYAEESVNNIQCMSDMLKASNVRVIENALPVEIGSDSVKLNVNGEEVVLPSDTTVLATGYHPLNELAKELDDMGIECDIIGNAVKARKIINATGEAYQAIRRL